MSAIDDYLKKVSPPQKAELERVRKIVKDTVPDAEEVISYGMPAFKYQGKYLIGFAEFKDHMSLFPASAPIEVMKEKLSDFKLSKGTIQFSVKDPVPELIIRELVMVRLKEIRR